MSVASRVKFGVDELECVATNVAEIRVATLLVASLLKRFSPPKRSTFCLAATASPCAKWQNTQLKKYPFALYLMRALSKHPFPSSS